VAGLDIGSRTIALVELEEGQIADFAVLDTGVNPLERCQGLLSGKEYARQVATGYGRHLAAAHFAEEVISEISALAWGARHLYPGVRTVIDVGGQDSKAIALTPEGRVQKFEMNDRCAAGTGRFLEMMALAMGLSIEELGPHALDARNGAVPISSMCTVFAESEVVSLIARGKDTRRIALGLHQAIGRRITNLVRRVGVHAPVVFTGGVARNPCMRRVLAEELGQCLTVPPEPQIVGALGAALQAQTYQGG
jgi:predicted CoA-substrate-specific enzyme activase